jgi:hypothetical protein
MNEDFLQYIWRFQHLPAAALKCTSGREVSVLFQGHWNRNAGPDFYEARLRIGRELWIGSVEVHVRSSEWRRHGHSGDPAYANVILHVVLEDDAPLVNDAGQDVPTLILKPYISEALFERYQSFIATPELLPCAGVLHEIEPTLRSSWLHRMAIERMEQRSSQVAELLIRYKNDWNAVWWHMLCRAFGFGLNQTAFEFLAMSLPWNRLARIAHRSRDLEAVIAVQSGWQGLDRRLHGRSELVTLYSHYQRMWSLKPVHPSAWRRGKMKPANHPRVRLGQLAAMVAHGLSQWQSVSSCLSLNELQLKLKCRIEVSGLNMRGDNGWTEGLGASAVDRLLTNAVLPLLFYDGRLNGDQEKVQRAIDWMDKLCPEDNKVTRMWKSFKWQPKSMLEAQGQLHLFRNYCSMKKCLSCSLGIHILNQRPP